MPVPPPPAAIPLKLQALPPQAAHFCLGVERFVRGELGLDLAGRTVLVGFSGGLDSTTLLAALAALAPRLGCAVAAAHLDHGLRPESGAEAERARALCAALGLPCEVQRQDVGALAAARGLGQEEAAREARYAFLGQAMDRCGATVLAVGHMLDDLAEDVLMRLVRGAGWPQLGGMRAWDPGRRLLRPLLLTPRARARAFATALALPWTEDPSNADPRFLRNRVRHALLPQLLAENPNFLRQVASQWRLARLDAAQFAAETAALLARAEPVPGAPGALLLPGALLAPLAPAQRLRLFKAALEAQGPGQPLAEGLLRLERAWASGRQGATVQFPGAKTARVAARGVTFARAARAPGPPDAP
ncbi:tRNA lysidine(34) synthetase TilS [Desulfocurvus vexinensis]|uniref:tRNA lysidine(34) synthetase TilS n=1 Tax=Desulfocurvus vexinensis TaxID=399548 RepID=UPI0004AC631D|nr:tRNA lysidine(34) synthetase TilS [Desulfocurvus vexinensis]